MYWAVEIEKKFLVNGSLPDLTKGEKIIQGFLFSNKIKEGKVRVYDDSGVLSIKFQLDKFRRERIDIPLSRNDAIKLLSYGCSKTPIYKVRYRIKFEGMDWDIDFFEGKNNGLILAEIELKTPSHSFEPPPWIEKEVTDDYRYYNAYLYKHPYSIWKQ